MDKNTADAHGMKALKKKQKALTQTTENHPLVLSFLHSPLDS